MVDRLPWDQAVEEARRLGKTRFVHDSGGRAFAVSDAKGRTSRGKPGVVVFGLPDNPLLYEKFQCKHCAKLIAVQFSKRYLKCLAMAKWRGERPVWSRGPGSEIRAGDPACAKFEPQDENWCNARLAFWRQQGVDLAERPSGEIGGSFE